MDQITRTRLAAATLADPRWAAVAGDDRAAAGFLIGVRTTGVYCRPGCPARRPNPENVSFFDDAEGARRVGLRACKRCRPDG